MKRPPRTALALAVLLRPPGASAQDETAEPPHTLELHGFLALEASDQPRRDLLAADQRLRVDLSLTAAPAAAVVRADLFHDSITRSVTTDLREVYISYAAGPLDLRAGRLVETWGVGDLVYINDLFPKDWDAFYSGRSLEYLKLGVDGAEARLSAGRYGLTAVAAPTFTPDRLPGDRFSPPSPLPVTESPPPPSAASTQLALRASAQLGSLDLALYAQRGFWRTPSLAPDPAATLPRAILFYPPLSSYGASLQANIGIGGTLSAEAAYYDSRQDRGGTDPTIPNSQWRALAAYQRPLAGELALGVQVYLEQMFGYAQYRAAIQPGSPLDPERRWILTARLTDQLWYGSLRGTLFAAYSLVDRDFLVGPEIDLHPLDNLGLTLGSHVMGGPSSGFFGRLARASNVYLRVRYDF